MVWCVDVICVHMKHGFEMYGYGDVIIDVTYGCVGDDMHHIIWMVTHVRWHEHVTRVHGFKVNDSITKGVVS